MSAHSKFSIKAFWKRLCSSPWTPEDTGWPQHQNIKWTKKRKRCASPLGSGSDGVKWYEEEKFCHLSCLRIVIWQWWWLRHWENHCSYQKRESGCHSSVKEQKSPKECYPKKTSLKAMGLEEMAKAIQGMKTGSLNPCFPVLSLDPRALEKITGSNWLWRAKLPFFLRINMRSRICFFKNIKQFQLPLHCLWEASKRCYSFE